MSGKLNGSVQYRGQEPSSRGIEDVDPKPIERRESKVDRPQQKLGKNETYLKLCDHSSQNKILDGLIPAILPYALAELGTGNKRALEGVDKFLNDPSSKDSNMDDCIRWHLLLKAVNLSEDRFSKAGKSPRTQLSEIILKPRPYLAFENISMGESTHKGKCIDLNHKDSKINDTPFLRAAKSGHSEIIKTMISCGESIYQVSDIASTSISPGVQQQKSFSDVLRRSIDGEGALMLAVKHKDEKTAVETLKALLVSDDIAATAEGSPDDDDDDTNSLRYAIKKGLAMVVEQFASHRLLVETFVTTKYIKYALDIFKIREAQKQKSVSIKNNTPDQGKRAEGSGEPNQRLKIIITLVSRVTKPDILNREVIEKIISTGQTKIWSEIPQGMLTTDIENSLLHLAVWHQQPEFVDEFLTTNPGLAMKRFKLSKDHEEDEKYPLWYNNRSINRRVGDSSRNTSIRNKIVNKLIYDASTTEIRPGVPGKETLTDILYHSDEQVGELCFDISGLKSTSYRMTDFVLSLTNPRWGKHILRYEETLRYAAFPQLDMSPEERECYKSGTHLEHMHEEVFKILDWLAKNKVKRIIKLKIPDRLINPHDDEEMAKQLEKFKVEILEWKVLDLSISAFGKETKTRIRGLYLYSSGNLGVIEHWFGPSGIPSLKNLERLEIKVVRETCTSKRLKYIRKEIDRRREELLASLEKASPKGSTKLSIEPPAAVSWFPAQKVADLTEIGNRLSPRLGAFLPDLYHKMDRPHNLFRSTRVAILDNGVLDVFPQSSRNADDLDNVGNTAQTPPNIHISKRGLLDRIKEGRSFVDEGAIQRSWLFASDPHGTQMANLICSIDPSCDLYIAKVTEGRKGITPKRVAQALAWAISKDVDIISMSFTIGENATGRDDGALTKQITTASEKGIVMTCSAHDEGARIDNAAPAKFKSDVTSLFVLAASDEYGRLLRDCEDSSYHYRIPGKDVVAGAVPFLDSEKTISGSSVATAIAAGLCSLILTLDRLSNPARKYGSGTAEGSRYAIVNSILRQSKQESQNFILLDKVVNQIFVSR